MLIAYSDMRHAYSYVTYYYRNMYIWAHHMIPSSWRCSWDFRLQVFYNNQSPPGPYWGNLELLQKFAEIFATLCLSSALTTRAISYWMVLTTSAIYYLWSPCYRRYITPLSFTSVNEPCSSFFIDSMTPAINLSPVIKTPQIFYRQ